MTNDLQASVENLKGQSTQNSAHGGVKPRALKFYSLKGQVASLLELRGRAEAEGLAFIFLFLVSRTITTG
jgi:hypothetical protein